MFFFLDNTCFHLPKSDPQRFLQFLNHLKYFHAADPPVRIPTTIKTNSKHTVAIFPLSRSLVIFDHDNNIFLFVCDFYPTHCNIKIRQDHILLHTPHSAVYIPFDDISYHNHRLQTHGQSFEPSFGYGYSPFIVVPYFGKDFDLFINIQPIFSQLNLTFYLFNHSWISTIKQHISWKHHLYAFKITPEPFNFDYLSYFLKIKINGKQKQFKITYNRNRRSSSGIILKARKATCDPTACELDISDSEVVMKTYDNGEEAPPLVYNISRFESGSEGKVLDNLSESRKFYRLKIISESEAHVLDAGRVIDVIDISKV